MARRFCGLLGLRERRVHVGAAALLSALILVSSAFGSEVSFTKALAPGVVLKQVVKRGAPDPMVINVLEVNPKAPGVKLKCIPAVFSNENGPAKRRDTVSSVAARIGCLAAVNASFFNMQTADTIGLVIADGELLSEPYPNWVCVGWDSEGKVMVDVVTMQASVEAGGRKFPISGLNRTRRQNELVVYTRAYGLTTPNNASGNEVVVVDVPVPLRPGVFEGRVSQVRTYAGSAPIPADGLVLSGHGPAAEFIGSLRQGDTVRISISLKGADGLSWDSVQNAVSGNQYLVKNGKPETANLKPALDVRHPRTVLGIKPSGEIL
ncbi:MAG: phosphodiester glycosidase family protein, partial [Armatimonadota bacterium]